MTTYDLGVGERSWARVATVVLALVLIVVGLATPARAASTTPAYSGDFPDPFVLSVSAPTGTLYYAYATGSAGRNLQVMSSTDLRTWSGVTDPLPTLPTWASRGRTWAPGVLAVSGVYRMYYAVQDTTSGRQCISVATSTPTGGATGFSDTSHGPLVCQLDRGGSIDPSPFVAPDGSPYLLWKSDDNALGQRTSLWAQKLTADGLALVGTAPMRLLTATSWTWQRGIVEGPSMQFSGGVYYLFYGAGHWDSASAGLGYATCSSPVGPCTDRSWSAAWVGSHGAATGPSGPAVFSTNSGLRMAYHAWQGGVVGYQNGGVRDLWVDALTFSSGPRLL